MPTVPFISQFHKDLRHVLSASQRLFGCSGVFLYPQDDHMVNPPLIWINCKTIESIHAKTILRNIIPEMGYMDYILGISINIIGFDNDDKIFEIAGFVEQILHARSFPHLQQYKIIGCHCDCIQMRTMDNSTVSHLACLDLNYRISIRSWFQQSFS